MSASHQLRDAYKEWRRLAETEGEAIRSGNWVLVADCQNALQQLQPRILSHLQDARREWTRLGPDGSTLEQSFREVVAELIEIERHNSDSINAAQAAARLQLARLEQTVHTLRQVQRSYAPPPPPAWTSFS
jgi:predicted Zn-dependent protease